MRGLLGLVSVVVAVASCSPRSANGDDCGSASGCAPGSACVDGTCYVVCAVDRDCSSATLICQDNLCREGQRSDAPRVDRVDSDGPADPSPTHAGHYLGQRLTLYGSYLNGASVDLLSGQSQVPLEICSGSDSALTVLLPADTVEGTYTLRVASQAAGSCDVPLQLLQGVPGEQGPQGGPGVPCAGCVDSASIAMFAVGTANLAIGAVDANRIAANAVGDAQLAFDTGQHLTATSNVTFNGLTLASTNLQLQARHDDRPDCPTCAANTGYYERKLGRYTLSIDQKIADSSYRVDQTILEDYCSDIDGCKIGIGMIGWNAGIPTSRDVRQHFLYYDPATGVYDRVFMTGAVLHGTDGDSVNTVIEDAGGWHSCYLLDYQRLPGSDVADTAKGLWLHWSLVGYNQASKICFMTIDD